MIIDKDEKPITADQAESEPSSGNGQSHDKDTVDVRTVPMGTLIYNLIRYTTEELATESILKQVALAKQAQGMVGDPPGIEEVRQAHEVMVVGRNKIANEINLRTRGTFAAYLKEIGIDITDLEKAEQREG